MQGVDDNPGFPCPYLALDDLELCEFSVSVVVFHSDPVWLHRCLTCLEQAVVLLRQVRPHGGRIILSLIDNGAVPGAGPAALPTDFKPATPWLTLRLHAEQGNVGYGAGHNLAIAEATSNYHLVLNPDAEMAPDALLEALTFLDAHHDVVALAPRIVGGRGELQYLCRRYPSLADLFVRGFLPVRWRRHFASRLAAYEMRSEIDRAEGGLSQRDFVQPLIISGCFMLFRTAPLQRLGGFDPRYFLYFEDYDLSLRAGKVGRLAYVPSVRIIHHGGGAARKGRRHVQMFVKSAGQFFNRFGWRWL